MNPQQQKRYQKISLDPMLTARFLRELAGSCLVLESNFELAEGLREIAEQTGRGQETFRSQLRQAIAGHAITRPVTTEPIATDGLGSTSFSITTADEVPESEIDPDIRAVMDLRTANESLIRRRTELVEEINTLNDEIRSLRNTIAACLRAKSRRSKSRLPKHRR